MKMHTYLNFGGNCLEAFRFYEEHLGGKIFGHMTYRQAPGATPPAGMEDQVMWIRMNLAGTDLMGADSPTYQPVASSYLSLSVSSEDEAERVHAALADGGQVFVPMAETFFAFRFSMLRDRFGVLWMVIYERPMPS